MKGKPASPVPAALPGVGVAWPEAGEAGEEKRRIRQAAGTKMLRKNSLGDMRKKSNCQFTQKWADCHGRFGRFTA
jgi:hypothetical protein